MADQATSSNTVDFALVETIGINKVASELGISVPAVRRWRTRGMASFPRLGGALLVVAEDVARNPSAAAAPVRRCSEGQQHNFG